MCNKQSMSDGGVHQLHTAYRRDVRGTHHAVRCQTVLANANARKSHGRENCARAVRVCIV